MPTIFIKVKIDNTQRNSKCGFCGDKDETIYHIISKCSKLALKEYKSTHSWMGEVIYWEWCEIFKFGFITK